MPKEILLHLEFTMCSSLLCLLTMPLQTWQDGWKAQQSGCSITIPSRLVYFARHGLNQPWTDATWCHLPWLAPAAVWLFMLKEPWACPDSPLHTFLGVFFLYDLFVEWLRLQEEGDWNIWNCWRVPRHRPWEVRLMYSVTAYGNPEVSLLL